MTNFIQKNWAILLITLFGLGLCLIMFTGCASLEALKEKGEQELRRIDDSVAKKIKCFKMKNSIAPGGGEEVVCEEE